MKRQNNIREKDFFEVHCSIDKEQLSIKFPQKLYYDFERCLKSDEGMGILCSLYDEYSKLTEKQRYIFQSSVFDFADKIIGNR